MAGDDLIVRVHKDWIVEAKLDDAGGDLHDLGVGVRARITRVGTGDLSATTRSLRRQSWNSE